VYLYILGSILSMQEGPNICGIPMKHKNIKTTLINFDELVRNNVTTLYLIFPLESHAAHDF